MKVYINPNYGSRPDTRGDGGIRRVVEAQKRHLPKFGFEVVDSPDLADIINNHGAELTIKPNTPTVCTNHGLMWARYKWDTWADDVNARVIASMKMSDAITAPSIWVRDAIVRGMTVYPDVIYHGIEIDDFKVSKNPDKYILWNKARTDPVSDPQDMDKLARILKHRQFVSTFGSEAANVKLIGQTGYAEMQKYIANAGVYLATTRETFGIGTLEAMACGVPVVGWDFGGQSEIIINGETGYLVSPGDYTSLAQAVEEATKNRKKIGAAARQDVLDRWLWEDKIEKYANVFKRVYDNHTIERPKVSIVVTTYNLARYLDDCLKSVLAQSMNDWECLVVDDCSTDDPKKIVKGDKFQYLKTPQNVGLCGARNYGIERARGKYIIMLDADDMLDYNALAVLSEELDKNRSIHIAYGHLDTVDDKGENRARNSWPFQQFDWREQMAHLNQLPYAAMVRREVWENAGGYRKRAWRAEDANQWCRLTSFGYVARKVTNASTLVYRNRSDSKSKGEPGDGDWTRWYPWRIAGSPREAKDLLPEIRSKRLPDQDIVPFGAQGEPPYNKKAWPVHDRAYPVVSVVIPVGPGHEPLVIDAVESIMAQTYPEWEVIVVNDTGKKWKSGFTHPLAGAPYAKIIETKKVGTGAARNAGAGIASGQFLVFLDADDMLLPKALETFLAYYGTNQGIIYCDWLRSDSNSDEMTAYEQDEFECGAVLKKLRHSVTSLVPKSAHDAIGGFDEKMLGWEDWDYYIALQAHGLCSFRVPEPLFVYRFRKGKRREESYENKDNLVKYIRDKWSDYYDRRKFMPCSGCGKTKKPKAEEAKSPALAEPISGAMVNLEYFGPHIGPVTIRGGVTGKEYRFGRTESHKIRPVDIQDAEILLSRTSGGKPVFKKV